MIDQLTQLLLFLVLTVLLEGTAVFICLRKKEAVYYSMLANLLTNPAFNFVFSVLFWWFLPSGIPYLTLYFVILIPLELLVVLIEAQVYRYLTDYSFRQCLLLSVFLNLLSATVGVVITLNSLL